jgi:hypothetical protein
MLMHELILKYQGGALSDFHDKLGLGLIIRINVLY